MSRISVYHKITNSEILYEVYPINYTIMGYRQQVFMLLMLNLLILSAYFVDVRSFNILSDQLSYIAIILLEIVYVSVAVVILSKNNARRMRLIFTTKGLALFPNTFICGFPVSTLIAEEWDDIENYSIQKLEGLMTIGVGKSKKLFLFVRTRGLVRRCVNNYGISVFAITGHLLDEQDIVAIHEIFAQFGIPYINEANADK